MNCPTVGHRSQQEQDLSVLISVVSSWLVENQEDDRREAVLRSYGQLLGLLNPASPFFGLKTATPRGFGNLVSLKEVAELAGVTPTCASNWRSRYRDFPRDLSGKNRAPLFDRTEVELWITKHQQKPHTRRKRT